MGYLSSTRSGEREHIQPLLYHVPASHADWAHACIFFLLPPDRPNFERYTTLFVLHELRSDGRDVRFVDFMQDGT